MKSLINRKYISYENNYMKLFLKKFAQVGGVVALSLVLGIGVSVFATDYVGPGAFPANAPVPLNVLETPQMKGYSTDPGLTLQLDLGCR
jgi:hypothetical protein